MTTISGKDAERFLKEKKRIENLDPNSKEAKQRKKYFKECERVYKLTSENSCAKICDLVREKDNGIAELKHELDKWVLFSAQVEMDLKRRDKEIGELKKYISLLENESRPIKKGMQWGKEARR